MNRENGRIDRLRRWVYVLVIVVVLAAFVAPFTLGIYFQAQANKTQLVVTCLNAESGIERTAGVNQIGRALEDITMKLGIPFTWEPIANRPVPPECGDT